MNVQKLVLVISFCLLVNIPLFSFADNFSDGINATITPDNKKATRIFRVSAEEGDRNSQHSLMVYHNKGIPKNYIGKYK